MKPGTGTLSSGTLKSGNSPEVDFMEKLMAELADGAFRFRRVGGDCADMGVRLLPGKFLCHGTPARNQRFAGGLAEPVGWVALGGMLNR